MGGSELIPCGHLISLCFSNSYSPWVILNDFGGKSLLLSPRLKRRSDFTQCGLVLTFFSHPGAFAMGAVGGTVWHGIKGARNSPRGDRLIGSISAIKARAPVVGGNFGVWGGLFSTFDCAVKGYRQKEDPYNAIISGFLTGGTLAVRSERFELMAPAAVRIQRCGERRLTISIYFFDSKVVLRECWEVRSGVRFSWVSLKASVSWSEGSLPLFLHLRKPGKLCRFRSGD